MGGRRTPEEETPRGCPDWIVTFSDVISLLVTFFVLILTFSTLEVKEQERLLGHVRGAFGVMTPEYISNRDAVYQEDALQTDREMEKGADNPFTRDLEELVDDLKELSIRKKMDTELKIHEIEGGLKISIAGDRLFDPGSVNLRSDFLPTVKEIADLLGYYPNELVVAGHTDATFTGTSRYPEGLELAGAMAQQVAEVMIREGDILPKRVAVASYGTAEPVASNLTPQGRAQNRRVEIIVRESRKEY